MQHHSVQLLADLAAGHAGNQQRLREAGVLELLVAALPRFFSQDALDAGKGQGTGKGWGWLLHRLLLMD